MAGLDIRDGVYDKLATFFPLPDRSECPVTKLGKGDRQRLWNGILGIPLFIEQTQSI